MTSQGKEVESARANLREAIELYLETWDLPENVAEEGPFPTFVEATRWRGEAAGRSRRARCPGA